MSTNDRTIIAMDVHDVRFPTSEHQDGSDAMFPDPDYSAAYVVLRTDASDGIEGHGLTFTIGRGNELCVAAAEALRPLVIGLTLEDITADMGAFWRRIVGDSQLRWVGPEKGVLHLATAAVVNAVWDLWAKVEGVPLWKLLVSMSPEELVRCVDFRYITDAITPEEAIELLRRNAATRADREAELIRDGYPAYTTSQAGSATPMRKSGSCAERASRTDGRTSRSRSGAIWTTTFAARGIIREEIGPIAS
jgi:L-fuconate dehydratase